MAAGDSVSCMAWHCPLLAAGCHHRNPCCLRCLRSCWPPTSAIKIHLLFNAGLVDLLQGEHLCSALQLNAILCLVDLTGPGGSADPGAVLAHDIWADQVRRICVCSI